MRFSVELTLENPYITKEKNKMIMHILKLLFENTDKEKYNELYKKSKTKEKNFTFSTYLGKNIKFNRDCIFIPDQRILLNFSTYDLSEGILFYNSFINNIGLEIDVYKNKITINDIKQKNIGLISEDIIFSSASPIIIRDHKGDNNKTWYYDILDKNGFEVFKKNLTWQLNSNIDNVNKEDIENIKIEIIKNKTVKIKHYGIVILGNLTTFRICAKAYIIDYLYKAGIGSRRSQGFGYLNIENKEVENC